MREHREFQTLRLRAQLTVSEAADVLGYGARTVYRWESGQARPRLAAVEALRGRCREPAIGAAKARFTFVDLFAGIGGMRLAFEASGGRCVATCEWNKYARQTYAANFDVSDHPFPGDIRQIAEDDIPPHDILVGGFPCQPFSIAGVSKKNSLGRAHGFACEAQGTLFFDLARIIAHRRPKAFLLENVKNLVAHDRGRTFRVILDTLQYELSYHVEWSVLDAKPYVPQHRERTFIVGFAEDAGFRFRDIQIPPAEKWPTLRTILHPEDGGEEAEPPYTQGPKAKVDPRYTLTPHLWEYLQAYAAKHRAAGNGFGFGLVGRDDTARTLSARYYKDGSEILVKQRGKKAPRRLTPRECARLMGFDAPGGKRFEIPVSDTQAYKQFGNAVVVPVVASIAREMVPYVVDAKYKNVAEPLLPFAKVAARYAPER